MSKTASPAHSIPAVDHAPHRPVWVCETCSSVIEDGAGVIDFRYREYDENRLLDAEWTERHTDPETGFLSWSPGDGDQMPGYVRLHVLHDRCCPERGDVYQIDLTRCRTWREVASWSAHLSEKQWFPHVNWADTLYRAGVGSS
jgi:hypothetical protein